MKNEGVISFHFLTRVQSILLIMINFNDWKKYKDCSKIEKAIQIDEVKRLEKGYMFYKESHPDKASVYLKEMNRLISLYELPPKF